MTEKNEMSYIPNAIVLQKNTSVRWAETSVYAIEESYLRLELLVNSIGLGSADCSLLRLKSINKMNALIRILTSESARIEMDSRHC